MLRVTVGLILTMIVVLVGIQFVPYGQDHVNPPVIAEPDWNSPNTRELAVRACYDCHSNQVNWPWYSNVAPFSWLVQYDVDKGRDELNFSEWRQGGQESDDDVGEEILEGGMPPGFYLLTNPSARLSSEETQALVAGLRATLGTGNAEDREDSDEDD